MSLALLSLRPNSDFRSDEIVSRQCRPCYEAFTKIPTGNFWGETIRIHGDLASLHMAATAGCSLCCFVARFYPKQAPPGHCPELRFSLDKHGKGSRAYDGRHAMDGTLFIWLSGLNGVNLHSVEIKSTQTFEKLPNQCRAYLKREDFPVPSDKSFAIATYNNCLENHWDCQIRSPPWHPSRLIEVSWQNTVPSLRLTITKADHQGHYVALSHCWGKSPIPKLTRENLHDMEAGICFSDLPRTFQDVVQVVGWLKVSYIWIDSLCIIQNSKEDWQKECSEMHKVYENSVCTISADRASEASMGCLGEHSPVSKCRIDIPNWGSFWLTDTSALSIHEGLSLEPLAQRAWAFQESALSFRNLHFSGHGLVWECQELITCQEVFEKAYTHSPKGRDVIGLGSKKHISRNLHHLAKAQDEDILEQWSIILENFPNRSITREQDRFPALSGVVKKFEEMLGDTYIAGLWRSKFPTELHWYTVRHSSQPPHRTSSYVAPSWSWASLKADIFRLPIDDLLRAQENIYFIDILEVSVQPVSDDHTGQIGGGFIRLIGNLPHVRFRTSLMRGSYLELFDVIEKDVQNGSVTRKSRGSTIVRVHIDVDYPTGEDELFFLPICYFNAAYHGLLLRETTKHGIFQRVGIAWTQGTGSLKYEYMVTTSNWRETLLNLRQGHVNRRIEVNFTRTEGMRDGPHNLFLGEPEVVHESFVRLVPREITII